MGGFNSKLDLNIDGFRTAHSIMACLVLDRLLSKSTQPNPSWLDAFNLCSL